MKKIFILLISITALFSCSSNEVVDDIIDDDPKPKELTGKYIVLEGPSNGRTTAYIDNSTISFLSEQDDFGTRARSDIEYEVVSDTEIDLYAPSTYSWSGNKLTIENDDTKYVMIKDADAPTADEWITPIKPEVKIQQSDFVKDTWRVNDMTVYGNYVYTAAHQNLNGDNVLTKINLNDFSTTELSIPEVSRRSLGYNTNIAYVGSNKFWVYEAGSSTEYMYEFDTNTLEETNRISVPKEPKHIYFMASNGNDLFGFFHDKLKKWNFVDQKWGAYNLDISGQLGGIAIDNDHVYVAEKGVINKYTIHPFKAVAAYNVSMDQRYYTNGMTLISKNEMVASVYNFHTKKNEIVTIALP